MTTTCKTGWRVSSAPDPDSAERSIVTIECETEAGEWEVRVTFQIAHMPDQDPVALVAEQFPAAFE